MPPSTSFFLAFDAPEGHPVVFLSMDMDECVECGIRKMGEGVPLPDPLPPRPTKERHANVN